VMSDSPMRLRSVTLAVVAVLLPALAGCDDAAGEHVMDALPVWEAVPELRIGHVNDPDFAFGTVAALQTDPEGRILSLHRQEGIVLRWTPDGEPAGMIGRQGEGPGEFSSPSTMGWTGDSLWVHDLGNHRVSFFDGEGTFLGNLTPRVDISAGPAGEGYPPRPAALLGDGTIHAMTPAFSREVVQGTLTHIAHVRMDAEGGVLDTLALVPVGRESVLGVLREDGGTFGGQPFGDATMAVRVRSGEGLLILDRRALESQDPAFRLTRIGLSGDTLFSRSYPYAPVPLPRDTVRAAIQQTAETLHEFTSPRTGGSIAQWRGWVEEAIYVPAHFTPVSRVVAGGDGTIWLELNPPPGPEQADWLVLDGEGEPLGRVRLPAGLRVLAADRQALLGVERDELDVEYIVRYRVESE
jgi:hypothetical protein